MIDSEKKKKLVEMFKKANKSAHSWYDSFIEKKTMDGRIIEQIEQYWLHTGKCHAIKDVMQMFDMIDERGNLKEIRDETNDT